jgi:iron complex outermembrane receptor protein
MSRSRFNLTGHPCLNTAGGSRQGRLLSRLPLASAISAILAAGMPVAHAAPAADADSATLEEVVVTAQKRTENLQDVPISIEVLDSTKLSQLNISGLDDYVKYSPSVAYSRSEGQGGNGQPGTSHIYMRGVTSGGNENHSGSQPSVGMYLDEQPVTTIDGNLDVHMYDIQRIEVLEGPQGTLYGASSQAGTVRIITNKPDPSKFESGYDLEGNKVDHGGFGWQAQGFVNIPLSSIAAVRLVGWDEHDGGYINNVAGTDPAGCIQNGVVTYPSWAGQPAGVGANGVIAPCPTPTALGAGSVSNAAYVKNDYNTVDTKGGRAALLVELGDNWTVSPTVMGQSLSTEGFFGYDPTVGDLDIAHFGPEDSQDTFVQSALTVEGKISNFDLVYAGAYLKHDTHSIADYTDYSTFYDRIFASGAGWTDNAGNPIMPQELVVTKGYFEKWSHEIRLTTPQDLPVKGTVGAFIQRQLHDIWEQYVMPGYGFTNPTGNPGSATPNPNGLGSDFGVPTLANTIWLTDEQRVDRDKAIFFQGEWDITSQWSLNGGMRYYKYDNSLEGFYGFGANHLGGDPGQGICFGPPSTPYAPCTDLDKEVAASGSVPKANVTYKITPDKMVYATYSKGFRPGGVNRSGNFGPYQADFLTNYEVGWKTQWFDHRLRWNGAAFWENWNDFQFSFLGPNSLTIIENGGNARIKGIENELEFQATPALNLSAGFTFLDSRLLQNICGTADVVDCPGPNVAVNGGGPQPFTGTPFIGPEAPAGSNLPISPKFKGNAVARYTFDEVGGWKPFGQVSFIYQTQTASTLLRNQLENIGMQPAYGLVDMAIGVHQEKTMIQLFVTNVADRRAQLTRFTETNPSNDNLTYIVPAQPRTIAIKFGQKF